MVKKRTTGCILALLLGAGILPTESFRIDRGPPCLPQPPPSVSCKSRIRKFLSHSRTALALAASDNQNDTSDDCEANPLGPLEDVLTRARKRSSNLWLYRLRAFTNQPILVVPGQYGTIFTVLDAVYTITALLIGAKGFAAGLLIGKLTIAPIRELFNPSASLMIVIMPLWPVVLAIVLDQVMN